MASSNVQRKLTAILCADVAGYSRLMGDDEKATVETLADYRKVFTSEIKKHRGRNANAPGVRRGRQLLTLSGHYTQSVIGPLPTRG